MISIMIIVMQFLVGTIATKAVAASGASNNIGFYVKAKLPENQLNADRSYFDLRMNPEQVQTIEVEVINKTDKDLNFAAKINDASTNSVGAVEYQIDGVRDESLKYSLTEIAVLEQEEFSVKPNQTYTFKINLAMPEETFDGELIGGIIITKINDQGDEEAAMSINNIFSYVVGLRLTQTDEKVSPDLELIDIKPETVNYRSAIVHSIRNSSPVLLEKSTMQIDIVKKGGQKPVWSETKDMLKMAPSSLMDYNMYIDASKIETGDYISTVLIKSPEQEWRFQQEFTIKSDVLKELQQNPQNVGFEKESSINQILLVAGVIIILFILVLVYLIYRSLKQSKQQADQDADKQV